MILMSARQMISRFQFISTKRNPTTGKNNINLFSIYVLGRVYWERLGLGQKRKKERKAEIVCGGWIYGILSPTHTSHVQCHCSVKSTTSSSLPTHKMNNDDERMFLLVLTLCLYLLCTRVYVTSPLTPHEQVQFRSKENY